MNLKSVLVIPFLIFAGGSVHAQSVEPIRPLVRVVDLSVGESTEVTLSNGKKVQVKLLNLKETRDPIRQAVRSAMVTVSVDGEEITLESGTYNLPQKIGAVQVDCSITSGYNTNGMPGFWGLDKDARLRLWPADSPLVEPGTFIYPVEQRWFATRTWFDNEPVDGGKTILKKIYYHSGLDIGGAEKQVKVIAATDAVVVSRGDDVLAKHLFAGGSKSKYGQGGNPIAPRYDVVYLMDGRGWFYRYSHLDSIDESVKLGQTIRKGDPIGILGKEGASGGWSHLHFEIKSQQPSGKWGTQAGYAILWEAYRNQYHPKLVANTRKKNFVMAGESVTLDGKKSYSADNSIQKYEWTFTDGTTASGESVTRKYSKPGFYSEILKVTDKAGNIDYDFAEVKVVDPKTPDRYPPGIHAAYWPSLNNKINDLITFKVRSFATQEGSEVWDFGDGSPKDTVKSSDGREDAHDIDGYAVTQHSYKKPGAYIVRVERSRDNGETSIAHLHVRVVGE